MPRVPASKNIPRNITPLVKKPVQGKQMGTFQLLLLSYPPTLSIYNHINWHYKLELVYMPTFLQNDELKLVFIDRLQKVWIPLKLPTFMHKYIFLRKSSVFSLVSKESMTQSRLDNSTIEILQSYSYFFQFLTLFNKYLYRALTIY